MNQILLWRKDAQITIFDHQSGTRPYKSNGTDKNGGIQFCGAKLTRRWYQQESLAQIRLAAKMGGALNAAAKRLLQANAVLDVSGGDSFTDLYGPWRFKAVVMPKQITIENNKPLILLPQTYGPFNSSEAQATASRILRNSAMAYARDERSFSILQDLLGDAYDPARHKCGVDVAFALQPVNPADRVPADLRHLFEGDTPANQPIGLNVSGLMYHNPDAAREQYQFKADYNELIHQLLLALLDRHSAPILLIPHVLTPTGHYESDPHACELARLRLPDAMRQRVHIVPPDFDAAEMKYIISRCQWFCGTRMHSTIAGLSSGVPTAAIAYSPKTQGVFETCGMGESVIDPRQHDTQTCVDALIDNFQNREAHQATLHKHLPAVLQQADQQMQDICQFIANGCKPIPTGSPELSPA